MQTGDPRYVFESLADQFDMCKWFGELCGRLMMFAVPRSQGFTVRTELRAVNEAQGEVLEALERLATPGNQ